MTDSPSAIATTTFVVCDNHCQEVILWQGRGCPSPWSHQPQIDTGQTRPTRQSPPFTRLQHHNRSQDWAAGLSLTLDQHKTFSFPFFKEVRSIHCAAELAPAEARKCKLLFYTLSLSGGKKENFKWRIHQTEEQISLIWL